MDGRVEKKKYKTKRCKEEGCMKQRVQGGVCVAHGANYVHKRCTVDGCMKQRVQGGVCISHGAQYKKKKRCIIDGCEKQARQGGVCVTHGAETKRCTVDGCMKHQQQGGVCISHGAETKRCKVEGCGKQRIQGGVCVAHGADRYVQMCLICEHIHGIKRTASCGTTIIRSCARCFHKEFPNEPRKQRRFKTKENYINERLKEEFGENFFIHDKRVYCGGCSKRRPDWIIDCGTFILIIECDEHKHKYINDSCEMKRLNEIWEDYGCRDLIVIRFNPDANETEKTCFKPIVNGGYEIDEEKLDRRMLVLIETTRSFLENGPRKNGIDPEWLFY